MAKKVLVVILGLCILAAAGADVYLCMVLARSDKVRTYSEQQTENTAKADGTENDNQQTEEQNAEEQDTGVAASMDGFSAGVPQMPETDNKAAVNDEASRENEAPADNTAAEGNAEEEELSNADYILPYSDSKYYKKKDLKKLTRQEVKLARNEIYARHGRRFTIDESVREYFEGKNWYQPTVDEVSDSEFNKYEIANRDLIIAYEKEKKWR